MDLRIIYKHTAFINCKHEDTKINCNLHFLSNVDKYTTEIVSNLLLIDTRIYELSLIIKYCLKYHEIISTNGISSYVAKWLIFFYLQQTEDSILPPINYFQKNMPKFEIDDANVWFNTQLKYCPKNDQFLSQLLFGFYSFYAKFDFDSQIICPALGRSMTKNEFESVYPESCDGEQYLTFLKIQDPFKIGRLLPKKRVQNWARNFYKFRIMRFRFIIQNYVMEEIAKIQRWQKNGFLF